MEVKIYYIPGSHPCEAVFKAAELKGIAYKRVAVLPPMHRLQMKLMFGARTVPAMKIADGPGGAEKVQTSRKIMRTFESIVPEPALYPKDPAQRERVLAAERWGDGTFQDVGRRLVWAYLVRSPDSIRSFIGGHKLPVPAGMVGMLAKPTALVQMKLNHADEATLRKDIADLAAMLDQVDAYIAEGVIGGEQPNAADLQILSSLWLWRSLADLRPQIDARPCGEAAQRVFGDPAGEVPAGLLPADWLAPLRAGERATA